MNIQALNIKVGDCPVRTVRGDRLVAYSKQKMLFLHGATVTWLDTEPHHTESLHICTLSGISLLRGSVSHTSNSWDVRWLA
jgi:hypothetical protein